jgi:hypothetical protein
LAPVPAVVYACKFKSLKDYAQCCFGMLKSHGALRMDLLLVHKLKNTSCNVAWWMTSCLGTDRGINSSISFDATVPSENDLPCNLEIFLFLKWLCQFRRVCKNGVRFIVTATSAKDSLLLMSVANVNSQQLYVFEMNSKVSPPIILPTSVAISSPTFAVQRVA